MSLTQDMEEKTVWAGKYKGISFEIQRFTRFDKACWTFYLFILIDSLPEDIRERFWLDPKESNLSFIHYDYYSEPLMSNLDWHSGMTRYSKVTGFDGEKQCVKIGCDYQHIWDEGREYTEEFVAAEAKACIDSLYERIPSIKIWCSRCGKYVDALIQYGKGEMCAACLKKREEEKS